MNLFRALICIALMGGTLLAFVKKQNQLTRLRLEIPVLEKETKGILEENWRLKYEIEQFEQPAHLFELSRKPEYGHLKYPYNKEILILSDE